VLALCNCCVGVSQRYRAVAWGEDELAEIDAAVDRDGAASRSRFVVEAALARARQRMPLRQAVDAVTRVLDEPPATER
jgi:uncharacterized protein (DUF1778 family)